MKILLTFILTLIIHLSFSQTFRLKGVVPIIDKDQSIGQMTVYNLSDSSLVKGSYVDSSYFSFLVPKQTSNQYYAKLRLQGYTDTIIPFEQTDSVINLGVIQLQKDMELETIEVVYREPEFKRSINGIEVSVGGTTLETLENLFEILKASPRLMSPDDESIEIIGKGTPLILVDRQPILSIEELKAIPANMVDRIEIITNPPARYRAEGKGNGVIEVFTKDFHLQGYNMNISASGGMNTQLKPAGSLGLGLSLKKKKFSLNANLNGNFNSRIGYGSSSVVFTDDTQRSTDWDFVNEGWHNWDHINIKSAYQINKDSKISLGFRSGIGIGASENNSNSYYNQYDSLQTYEAKNTLSNNTWTNSSGFITYYLETDTNKSNLEINLNYQNKFQSSRSTYDSDYYNAWNDSEAFFDFRNESKSNPNIGDLKLYYEHILDTSGWSWNTGGAYSLVYNKARNDAFNLVNEDWEIDPVLTNSYDYTEQIGNLFFEVSKDWEKFSARVGITGEFTYLQGYSNSLDKEFIDSTYILPFPSGSFMYAPFENFSVTASYNAGIDRPNFSRFDPFVRVIDSLTIEYGNPYLRPAISQNTALEFNFFNAYSLSVEYTHKNRPVSDITFVDQDFINNRVPWNSDQMQRLSVNLGLPAKIGKWLSGWNSINFAYSKYEFTDDYNRANYFNITYSIWSYLNFHLPGDMTITNRFYFAQWGSDQNTGRPTAFWGMRYTKKFFNNDFQIYADVRNIIPPRFVNSGVGANYESNSTSRWQFTTFKLGIYYKFGRLRQDTHIKESKSGQSDRI